MALFILFALIGIPLLEIAVFIRVGSDIGLGSTLAVTALTAVIGTVLMRTQGLSTLVRKSETASMVASCQSGRCLTGPAR